MAFKMKGSPMYRNYGVGGPMNKNGNTDPKKIRVSSKYKAGDNVSEDDLESKFKRTGGDSKDYPQLSVQDYSKVKVDAKGPYVVKLSE